MVKPIIVGAHYGLKDWLAQRITAIVMVVYTLIAVPRGLIRAPADHEGWRALFAPQWFRVATMLFVVALLWHAWIGVRDIYMDYVKPTGIRLTLHVVTIVFLIGYGLWAAAILWGGR